MILVYDIQCFEKGGGRIRSMAGTSIIETLFLFSKGLQESSVTIDISSPILRILGIKIFHLTLKY
jgi:hypothetical protein